MNKMKNNHFQACQEMQFICCSPSFLLIKLNIESIIDISKIKAKLDRIQHLILIAKMNLKYM